MHPYLTEQLVHDHIVEIRGSATTRSAGSRSARHMLPGHERVGRLLVTVGMRLVGDERRSHGAR
jgi:hypothetical protein